MLSQHEIMRVRLNEGDEVIATVGTVWLTFAGRDFILESGQIFCAPSRGEAMLQGLDETGWDFRVRINSAPRSMSASVRARISGWLHPRPQSGGTHPRAV